jgi:hypothetical protein
MAGRAQAVQPGSVAGSDGLAGVASFLGMVMVVAIAISGLVMSATPALAAPCVDNPGLGNYGISVTLHSPPLG